MSGGQQQRVGVARALAADPPVLLMDEPFGAVDPIVRLRLQEELLEPAAALHKTIVFVTHDIDEAIRLGDRVAVLNVGGVLEQYGPPVDVLAEPGQRLRARVPRGRPRAEATGADPGVGRRARARPDRRRCRHPSPTPASVMKRASVDWVAVLDGGSSSGLDRAPPTLDRHERIDQIRGDAVPRGRATRPTRCGMPSTRSSARPTQVVIVVDDDDRYLGLLDVARIGKGLAT